MSSAAWLTSPAALSMGTADVFCDNFLADFALEAPELVDFFLRDEDAAPPALVVVTEALGTETVTED